MLCFGESDQISISCSKLSSVCSRYQNSQCILISDSALSWIYNKGEEKESEVHSSSGVLVSSCYCKLIFTHTCGLKENQWTCALPGCGWNQHSWSGEKPFLIDSKQHISFLPSRKLQCYASQVTSFFSYAILTNVTQDEPAVLSPSNAFGFVFLLLCGLMFV